MHYNVLHLCKVFRHIEILPSDTQMRIVNELYRSIGNLSDRNRYDKVLHQVGLECFIAIKISINKDGSDMNAVFGINHSFRLTG